MSKYVLLVAACLALIFTACKHKTEFKEVQAPGKFTLQLPAYMKATTDLFTQGKYCLQYQNDSMQVYMLVFDTARHNLRETNLRDYYDSIVSEPSVTGAHIALPKQVKINGDSALVTEMTALQSNTPVFYRIEVIATPARFYYILLWCKQDKKEELASDFDKILGSFTDVNR